MSSQFARFRALTVTLHKEKTESNKYGPESEIGASNFNKMQIKVLLHVMFTASEVKLICRKFK
jgi:hypothetical protein